MATTDARRFHRLVEPHLDALFRAAYRLAGNSEDAEDLVQDTCIRAFQSSTDLHDSQSTKGWLLAVLYNRFVDGRRQAKRSPVTIEPVATIEASACPEPNPEESLLRGQSEEALHQAWISLDSGQQALLALRAEGYSSAEIAEIAGLPVEALYARLYRAKLSLAQHLKESSESKPKDRQGIAK